MPKANQGTVTSYARTARTTAEPYHHMPRMSTTSSESFSVPREPYHERPSVAWSTEDDKSLMKYRQQGQNWGPIAEHFPGKTPNACRKRHERLMERKNTSEWDTIKTEDLAAGYFECREAMWRILADHLGESKWQTLEAKCMEKGFKNLQTAARGARRGSNRHGSPVSHISDAGFDDSGLGPEMSSSRQHTPAGHVLPPLHPQQQQQQQQRDSPNSHSSPAARSNQSQPYNFNNQSFAHNSATGQYPPTAPTLEARPPVLTGSTASYNYPQYVASSSSYAMSYPAAVGNANASWNVPSSTSMSASANQRLPSLSENLNFLPPPMPFGGVSMGSSRHIATSTYG